MIVELLAVSLGVDRVQLRQIFEESNSLMRCNYYPPCKNPNLTLGTGPHCDPNSITILHQDHVGGLEVFSDNKWRLVKPRPNALVINIGDTFTVIFFFFVLYKIIVLSKVLFVNFFSFVHKTGIIEWKI